MNDYCNSNPKNRLTPYLNCGPKPLLFVYFFKKIVLCISPSSNKLLAQSALYGGLLENLRYRFLPIFAVLRNLILIASYIMIPFFFSFPTLPTIQTRGSYTMDKIAPRKSECKKSFNTHNKLVSGLFTISCQHGRYFFTYFLS